jgi:hypothetical protein
MSSRCPHPTNSATLDPRHAVPLLPNTTVPR